MTGKAAGSGGAMIPYAVWPQLLLLSNGALVLGSGRPGIGFWCVSHATHSPFYSVSILTFHDLLTELDDAIYLVLLSSKSYLLVPCV